MHPYGKNPKSSPGVEHLCRGSGCGHYSHGGAVNPVTGKRSSPEHSKQMLDESDRISREIKDKSHLIGSPHGEKMPHPRMEQRKSVKLAEGGPVIDEMKDSEAPEQDGDMENEMMDMVCEELCEAIHKKDPAGIRGALEAAILSILNKKD